MIIIQIKLTNKQARRFILAQQSLLAPRQLEGKDGILQFIDRVGCIQFDPLDQVGRNPDLVLQSRIKDYNTDLLQNLLYQDRKLIDGWDKNMSIYSVKDWPYFKRYRVQSRQRYGDGAQPATKILTEVRAELQRRGPLSSLDFKFEQVVDWSWAPTKIARAALESMYSWGELLIHHKIGTRKVYDFAEKHLPAKLFAVQDPNQSEDEYYAWYVQRRIGGVGMLWERASDAWLGIGGLKSRERSKALAQLQQQKKITAVTVEGINCPFYIRKEEEFLLEESRKPANDAQQAVILAPLDNLLWDRKLVKALFNFEYVWEVYKPAKQRKYGYYVLPILYGDQFIARFEPLLNRNKDQLIIKNWWWESGIKLSSAMQQALVSCLKYFMKYVGALSLRVNRPREKSAENKWLNGISE